MHSLVSCHRLLDVVDLVESDARVQVVFTVAPDVFANGVHEFLRETGALVVPWRQAIRERFDLALAAAYGGIHELHAPLAVMAHGAGHGKPVRPPEHGGNLAAQTMTYGLDPQRLVRDGRVLPRALVLAHENERAILRRQCPDAMPAATVAGDICFDRLVASRARRDAYRHAIGVDAHRKLVVISSTWGREGAFGGVPDLLTTIVDGLPADRFQVLALLHPAVWGAHGRRQVWAWTRDARAAGLLLPQPTDDWRAFVAAADYVIGDHGSVSAYAAAAGIPVLRPAAGHPSMTEGSPQDFVLRHAATLDVSHPLSAQLASAPTPNPALAAELLTSRPGEASRLLRDLVYGLLGLPATGLHRQADPVQVPYS
ncbi:hypothetical protein [Actinoplanes sp. NPDC049599]|uniref:hypothetical protein n=1 Tax=Actinoplanes sp. NPDC049599 TaxID=3363903 RepID=UPI00379187FE